MSDAGLRIDKWLWQARFSKTRTLAAKIVAAGVRLNGERVGKASTQVKAGDTLTFAQVNRVRVIRVVALGARRGPAAEAAELYEDLDPPTADEPAKPREGRPDKRDRRAALAIKTGDPN